MHIHSTFINNKNVHNIYYDSYLNINLLSKQWKPQYTIFSWNLSIYRCMMIINKCMFWSQVDVDRGLAVRSVQYRARQRAAVSTVYLQLWSGIAIGAKVCTAHRTARCCRQGLTFTSPPLQSPAKLGSEFHHLNRLDVQSKYKYPTE